MRREITKLSLEGYLLTADAVEFAIDDSGPLHEKSVAAAAFQREGEFSLVVDGSGAGLGTGFHDDIFLVLNDGKGRAEITIAGAAGSTGIISCDVGNIAAASR